MWCRAALYLATLLVLAATAAYTRAWYPPLRRNGGATAWQEVLDHQPSAGQPGAAGNGPAQGEWKHTVMHVALQLPADKHDMADKIISSSSEEVVRMLMEGQGRWELPPGAHIISVEHIPRRPQQGGPIATAALDQHQPHPSALHSRAHATAAGDSATAAAAEAVFAQQQQQQEPTLPPDVAIDDGSVASPAERVVDEPVLPILAFDDPVFEDGDDDDPYMWYDGPTADSGSDASSTQVAQPEQQQQLWQGQPDADVDAAAAASARSGSATEADRSTQEQGAGVAHANGTDTEEESLHDILDNLRKQAREDVQREWLGKKHWQAEQQQQQAEQQQTVKLFGPAPTLPQPQQQQEEARVQPEAAEAHSGARLLWEGETAEEAEWGTKPNRPSSQASEVVLRVVVLQQPHLQAPLLLPLPLAAQGQHQRGWGQWRRRQQFSLLDQLALTQHLASSAAAEVTVLGRKVAAGDYPAPYPYQLAGYPPGGALRQPQAALRGSGANSSFSLGLLAVVDVLFATSSALAVLCTILLVADIWQHSLRCDEQQQLPHPHPQQGLDQDLQQVPAGVWLLRPAGGKQQQPRGSKPLCVPPPPLVVVAADEVGAAPAAAAPPTQAVL